MGEASPIEDEIRDLLARGDLTGAATRTLRSYGPQLLAYLRSVLRDEDSASDGFSRVGEGIWRGIGGFRGESTVLAWSYRVAWGAVRRVKRDPYRRRARRLATSEAARLAAEVRDSTLPFEKPQNRDALARLRESLSPDEQTLLILRIDRGLPWKDLAQVFAGEGATLDEAALRKRFERLVAKLRKLAREEGLLR